MYHVILPCGILGEYFVHTESSSVNYASDINDTVREKVPFQGNRSLIFASDGVNDYFVGSNHHIVFQNLFENSE